ncbi:hypothetical protein FH608_028130 [Nonomuraea phyllanthi]|uniref:Integrase n=1 Tax=Nonomuraea phyllanthi TaxID=2219224 RepID=A0A5C4W4N6_9ACTN|nr:hypothetical protein [Nonomuraea phyllanthi]KAB8191829.1 hypothetical protein FH608_028130 [Nonomuraea phyllanthi]
MRDYKTHLKTVAKRKANAVHAHLAALDHFFTHRGPDPVQVRRDTPPKLAPQALDARRQKRFLRAVEMRRPARDRALGRLLFPAAARITFDDLIGPWRRPTDPGK